MLFHSTGECTAFENMSAKMVSDENMCVITETQTKNSCFQKVPKTDLLYILISGRNGFKNDIKCIQTDSPSYSEQYPPKIIVLGPKLYL